MRLRHNGSARTFDSVVRNCCETGTRGARFTGIGFVVGPLAAADACDAAAAAAALVEGRVLPPVSGDGASTASRNGTSIVGIGAWTVANAARSAAARVTTVSSASIGSGGRTGFSPRRTARSAVETALLDRACRPRQLRGPAELAFDLLDELPDLGGRGFRLLALDANE